MKLLRWHRYEHYIPWHCNRCASISFHSQLSTCVIFVLLIRIHWNLFIAKSVFILFFFLSWHFFMRNNHLVPCIDFFVAFIVKWYKKNLSEQNNKKKNFLKQEKRDVIFTYKTSLKHVSFFLLNDKKSSSNGKERY